MVIFHSYVSLPEGIYITDYGCISYSDYGHMIYSHHTIISSSYIPTMVILPTMAVYIYIYIPIYDLYQLWL